MFCQRAVLYRFTKDTAEWKERGRGDFKLLHNTQTGSYRVLMRREQVRVACWDRRDRQSNVDYPSVFSSRIYFSNAVFLETVETLVQPSLFVFCRYITAFLVRCDSIYAASMVII